MAQLVKNPPAMWGDLGLFPGLGISPGKGKGYPPQYSGLENSMDCIVHGVPRGHKESDVTERLSLSVQFSHSVMSNSLQPQLYSSWNSPGQKTGVE